MGGEGGVDILLKPLSPRSIEPIDLLVHGTVQGAMGENIVILGWAKTALALGCRRVLLFDSNIDFLHYVDAKDDQVYILDYISIPQMKDEIFLDDQLRQRAWIFAYWGQSPGGIRDDLGLTDEYGFKLDRAMAPYNYSSAHADNVKRWVYCQQQLQ